MIGYAIIFAWVVFATVWFYAAYYAKPPLTTPTTSPWRFLAPLIVCDALLIIPVSIYPITALPITGLILTLVGLKLAIVARHQLAKNWSGPPTIQQDHKLVTTGVYRWLRHPIYVGLTIAFAGTGLFLGDVRGLIAPIFAIIAFVHKARIEEQQLEDNFGADYRAYRETTLI